MGEVWLGGDLTMLASFMCESVALAPAAAVVGLVLGAERVAFLGPAAGPRLLPVKITGAGAVVPVTVAVLCPTEGGAAPFPGMLGLVGEVPAGGGRSRILEV